MKCKYFILILVIFLMGCKESSTDSQTTDSTASAQTASYIPLKIDLSGNNGVVTSNGTVQLSSIAYSVDMSLSATDCQTYGDIGTGDLESIVADPDRCYTEIERTDSTGGFVKWIEDSTTDLSLSPTLATSATVQKCGIIKPDGTVFETSRCPVKNGGFANSKALNRVSATRLRGLANDGNYYEYDQSNDTEIVIIDDTDNIDRVDKLTHSNKEQLLYYAGGKAKQVINGVTNLLPELDGKDYHILGDAVQFKDGSYLKRGYFDQNGVKTQGPNSMAVFNGSSIPVEFAAWISSGVGPYPNGPVLNSSFVGCNKSEIGGTSILSCGGSVYKYTGPDQDLFLVNIGALGGNSDDPIIPCSTLIHYYVFGVSKNISTGDYTGFKLTKIDLINSTFEYIFNNSDNDYLITSMSCSADSVTAKTATKTILIEQADTTPILTLTDIVIEGVI